MNIAWVHLADYAMVSNDGKVSVVGIFNRIDVPSLPAMHPSIAVVLRVQAEGPAEAEEGALKVRVVGPGGDALVESSGHVQLRAQSREDHMTPSDAEHGVGIVPSATVVVDVKLLRFETEGAYSVQVEIDGEVRAEPVFYVRRRVGEPPTPE